MCRQAGADISKLNKYGNVTEYGISKKYGDVKGLGRGAKNVGEWLDKEFGEHVKYSYKEFVNLGDSVKGIYLQTPLDANSLYHIDIGNSINNGSGFYQSGDIWFWPLK